MSVMDHKNDFIVFAEAGFIAVNQSDEDAAKKLFHAAHLLDPENTLPTIGLGYLHLHKLEMKKARELFEKVLKKEPKNDMVKTFLGLCMIFSPKGVEKGERILEETLHSKDNMVKKLSESAIDFANTFVKKKPSPMEASAPSRKKAKKTVTKGKKHGNHSR